MREVTLQILSEIRQAGASIRADPHGKLYLKGVVPEGVANFLRQNRDLVVADLAPGSADFARDGWTEVGGCLIVASRDVVLPYQLQGRPTYLYPSLTEVTVQYLERPKRRVVNAWNFNFNRRQW